MVADAIKGAAKSAVGAISPGAGKALGAAAAAPAVGKNVASWAALLGLEQLVDSIKDPGFVLFILGIVAHVLGRASDFGLPYYGYGLRIFFSVVLLGYAVLFIFKGRGLILITLLSIWYFIFGLSYDPSVLVGLFLALGIYFLLLKWKTGEFVIGEEVVGLLPLLFFYLDVGVLSFFVQRYGITVTPMLASLILYMPWWAAIGIFSTERKNMWISFAKIFSVAWIIAIVFVGAFPGMGFQSIVPGIEDIAEAQEQVIKDIKVPSSLRITWWRTECTLKYTANPQKINDCVGERIVEYTCKQEVGKDPAEIKECVEKNIAEAKKGDLSTKKELTKIKFEFKRPADEIYKSKRTAGSIGPMPYDILLENTRKEPIYITMSCKFKVREEEKEGDISPAHMQLFEFVSPKTSVSVTKRVNCVPKEPYKEGKYKVIFEAIIEDVNTGTELSRIFAATPETEKDVEDLQQILQLRKLQPVQKPITGEEFAGFYFEIGTGQTFIYSEYEPTQTIAGNPKNLKKGEVVNYKKVEIDLRNPGIIPGDCGDFVYRGENKLVWEGTGTPELNCQLEIAEEFRNLGLEQQRKPYEPFEFNAVMTYDYKMKKEDTFNVAGALT